MIYSVIPTQPVPSQRLTASLSNQACQIVLTQRSTGLFVDLYVNNAPIVLSVLALNLNRIVRSKYRGFIGDLTFVDLQGDLDPSYDGLNGRFELLYVLVS